MALVELYTQCKLTLDGGLYDFTLLFAAQQKQFTGMMPQNAVNGCAMLAYFLLWVSRSESLCLVISTNSSVCYILQPFTDNVFYSFWNSTRYYYAIPLLCFTSDT